MKKGTNIILGLILTLMILVSFFACGDSGGGGASSSPTSSSTDQGNNTAGLGKWDSMKWDIDNWGQ